MKTRTRSEKDIKKYMEEIKKEMMKKGAALGVLNFVLNNTNPEEIDEWRAMNCVMHEIAMIGLCEVLYEFASIKLNQHKKQGGVKNGNERTNKK